MITVNINGQVVTQIKQGLTTIERLDEELDSGLIIQVATTRKEKYPMFSDVIITRDNESLRFLVSSDDVELVGKNPLIYQHTIMIIEETKILERHTGSTLTFTQPLDGTRYTMGDVLQRTRDVIPFETVNNHYVTRLFDVDQELLDYANQFKAPQFFINRPTLFGALSQEMKYLKAVPRLKNNKLTADYFNELKELIDLNNISSYKQSHNIEYYATKLESYVDNQISESNAKQATLNYPNSMSFASVRSDDVRLTTNNMVFKVPYPIYKINKVYLRVKLKVNGAEQERIEDITSYVFESSAYAALPLGSPTFNTGSCKRRALRYDYQGTKIYGFGETHGFLSRSAIMEILGELTNSGDVALPNYDELLFNISYIPIFDTRIQVERANLIDVNVDSVLYSNQQERIVDLGSFGDNLYGQINRLANGDIEISKHVKTFSECFKKGQYTADNYIITVVKNQIFNDYIISSAVASKNFNKISEYVGINSEIRQYNIPGDGFTLERHERYSEYVEVSDTGAPNTSFVTFVGQSIFMQTFSRQSYAIPIEVTLFRPGGLSNLLLSCNSVASGNSLIFTFGFKDNLTAGEKVTKEGNDYINQYVRYTAEDGTLEHFSFALAAYATPGDDIVSQAAFAKNLPQIADVNYVKDVMISTPEFKLMKDPAEVFKMTYQLQIVTKKGLENTFVIGSELTSKNRMVYRSDAYKELYVFYSNEKYGLFEDKKAKGSRSSTEVAVYTDPYCKIEIPKIEDPSGTFKSWAIGDNRGNLFIACNDINVNTIYFNFKNKRG